MSVVPSDSGEMPTYPEYEFAPARAPNVPLSFVKTNGSMMSAHEKIKLYYENYCPKEDDLTVEKPVVVFYHGIQEHFARYRHVIERFTTLGFRVTAMDMRGHGLSTGKRSYVTRFVHYIDDAVQHMEENVLGKFNPKKVFLWGQSYGGLVAPHVCLRVKDKLGAKMGGILLTSCAVGVDKSLIMKIQSPLGPCVSSLLPAVALTPAVAPSMMSSDPEAVTNYAQDPLNTKGNLFARLAWETELAMRELTARTAEISCPLYMTHGSKDICTSRIKAKYFFEKVSSTDKVFVDTTFFHTMLHEPEREKVITSMEEWLKARI